MSALDISQYKASEIKVLEGLEPVRKRPGMYIGSTDTRGLHHLVKEILDNAVDEAIAGFGNNIALYRLPVSDDEQKLVKGKLGPETITVVDGGRGIPVDKHESGLSALEVVLTKLHAGGKFEETAYQASGGLHGVGSSAVNALSAFMQVVVKRDGGYYYQYYQQGRPQAKVKVITEDQVKKMFPVQSNHLLKNKTGTLIQFAPDPSVFSTTEFKPHTLTAILKDRAYLMAGIYFQLHDGIKNSKMHFYFESGIKSLVEHINMTRKPLHSVMHVDDFYTDPEQDKKIGVEVALQYNDSFKEILESYVNVIRTTDGGAHVNGFRMALGRVLRDYAKKHELLKDKENFTSEDIKEGLAAVVFVKMPSNDLQFESQTKTRLNNTEAQSAVYQVFKDAFTTYLEENPRAGRAIIEKIMVSARARLAARAAKDAVIRKGVLEGSSLPGKLADCQSKDPAESEIYIVEGDSAGGCFSGDTKVALADGRHLTFKELVEEQKQGKEHFCYTIRKDGKVGLERALHARRTKRQAEVIQVELDNGQKITCTPDHRFMLRDGSYKQAAQLQAGDSLMPLYRRYSKLKQPGITLNDYEMVWDPKSETWVFTHLLADWYNRWRKNYNQSDGDHCHHRDFNKLNNDPTNLQRLPAEEHLELHRQHATRTIHRPEVIDKCRRLRQSPAFRKKMSQRMLKPQTRKILSDQAKEQWANNQYKKQMKQAWLKFYEQNKDYQEKVKSQLYQAQETYWKNPKNRQRQSDRVKTFFQTHPQARHHLSRLAKSQWQDKQLVEWRRQQTKAQWTPEFRAQRRQALRKTGDKSLLKFQTLVQRYFDGDKARALDALAHYNHQVKTVTPLKKRLDVYDLEVPGTHNFALASGVFVHNSAKQGRDRRFQAIFPLRGKILNTERARLDKIVAFEELKNLVIALGAGIGETFDVKNLRYHRIILMNDADVDGEHITTLGLTFFFRHLPQIVEEGFLYVAMPPLYKVTSGKTSQYLYTEEAKEEFIKKIRKQNPKAKIAIQRYKGLGEMNPDQLWETTMNPKTRMLKRITIEDADKADTTFSTLMGDDVPPRKKFIQTHAKLAEIDV